MGTVNDSLRALEAAALLLEADVDSLDGRALAARLREVDRAIRKLEAVAVSFGAELARREEFRDAGGYARPACAPPPN